MMEAAYQMGKYLIEVEGRDLNEVLTEQPNVQNIIILKLELEGETISNFSIDIERYDFEKHNKLYPYRRGESRGVNFSPVAILTSPKKTFNGKILAWFKKNAKKDSFIEKVKNFLKQNAETVIERLSNNMVDFKRDISFLLTVDFIPEDLGREFWGKINEELKNKVLSNYCEKYDTISKGKGICFHCGRERGLYGFASPFGFYNHDKVTYASNFVLEQVWKQYPVCGNCALITEFGAKEIRQFFNYDFFHHKYWLFTNFLSWETMEEVMFYLREYAASKDLTTGERRINLHGNLTDDENEILDVLSNEDDILTITLLFYRKQKSEEKILTVIHDVLPSRLSKLYNAKKELENTQWLTDWWNGLPHKMDNQFQFNFGNVRKVFPRSFSNEAGRSDIFGQQFLEITRTAFTGQSLDMNAILHPAIQQVRHLYANRNQKKKKGSLELILIRFIHTVVAVIEYYHLIGCIGGFPMKKDIEQILKELKIEHSELARKVLNLSNSSSFFDNSYKKGVFILGILTHKITTRQYQELKSKPFFEKLDGLRLNPRKIQRLFPEIIAKLTEYDSNTREASALETLASRFFMDQEPIPTNEEISFAFAMGLSYGNAIWQG